MAAMAEKYESRRRHLLELSGHDLIANFDLSGKVTLRLRRYMSFLLRILTMTNIRILETNLNVGHSLFDGYNDRHGLMLCGYEWGTNSINDGSIDHQVSDAIYTFADKSPRFGKSAFDWPYDRKIRQLFAAWGHPLTENGLGSSFDKCIVQTNWCDSEGHHVEGSYTEKLLHPNSINNFVHHLDALRPLVLIFFGIRQLELLQDATVLNRFVDVFGVPVAPPSFIRKPFKGRSFRVGFQKFERINIAAFPHPSGSHGLSMEYLSLFKDDMQSMIRDFKIQRGIL